MGTVALRSCRPHAPDHQSRQSTQRASLPGKASPGSRDASLYIAHSRSAMTSLPSDRRRQLENVVQRARDVAEAAARAAVNRLDVASAKPWDGLTPEERDLRNRLRAHARQLGDSRGADGTQEVERLVTEIAYQQWHRMLFARFLAENDLLIHPDLGVPVTLEECD